MAKISLNLYPLKIYFVTSIKPGWTEQIKKISPKNITKILCYHNQKYETPFDFLNKNICKGKYYFGFINYNLNKNIEDIKDIAIDDLNLPHIYFVESENITIESFIPIYIKEINFNNIKIKESLTKYDFLNCIKKIKKYIAEGDVYQVNFAQRLKIKGRFNPEKIFNLITSYQPVHYAALFQFPEFSIISNSMELFLKKTGNKIITQPIKGTIRRGRDKKYDNFLKQKLKNSIKDKAENLMIVDMARNDLGKICKFNSVKVEYLWNVYKYQTLWQMKSQVSGVVKDNLGFGDILKATFPPASVTGTPKKRAMEIIEELEPYKRNIYCGCIGIIFPDGNFTLSVSIRNLIIKNNFAYVYVGSGIVWDSNPQKEYNETLLKAKPQLFSLNYGKNLY